MYCVCISFLHACIHASNTLCVRHNFCHYRDNQYNGFGLSGSDASTLMLGADAVITWVDDDLGPHAEDYYLNEYLQVDRHRHMALCV